MKCHEVRSRFVAYLDGEIAASEHALLTAHLADCQSCQQELAALDALRKRLRQGLHSIAEGAEPSPQVWNQLEVRLVRRTQAPYSNDVKGKKMQRRVRLVLAASLIGLLLLGLFMARGTSRVSAQDILDRAYAAQQALPQTQGIQHTRTEQYLLVAMADDGKTPKTETHTTTESYLDVQTANVRTVTSDITTGRVTYAFAYDGINVYTCPEGGNATGPLTIYRSPVPAGWRDIYGYIPGELTDPKQLFDADRKDPDVTLIGQEPWIDGRTVYVLRTPHVKAPFARMQGIDGYTLMYFDAQTYELVESKGLIERDGKQIVVNDYRVLIKEALPQTASVAWDLKDLKGVNMVDDAKGEQNTQWLIAISEQELAARTQTAYKLATTPQGFTLVIAAPSSQPKEEPVVYSINYRSPSGDYFLLTPQSRPDGAIDATAEKYTTASGLTLYFQKDRADPSLDKPISIATAKGPNNASFELSSNLPREQVKALAEQLVLVK